MALTSLVYRGIKFDSDEEVFFAMWLQEFQEYGGFIKSWNKNINPIKLTEGLQKTYDKITQLKTRVKIEERTVTILRPSEYTPDFIVQFNSAESIRILTNFVHGDVYRKSRPFFVDKNMIGIFEVKPAFDQNNMERLFVNNQKFIWDKYKIFVNLVEPFELFKKTFVPVAVMPYLTYKVTPQKKGKKKGDFKFDWKPKNIHEYLKQF